MRARVKSHANHPALPRRYDEVRAANVVATEHVKVLTMSRAAFEEVVGSLEDILGKDQKRRENKLNKINRVSTYRNFHEGEATDMLRGCNRDVFKVRRPHRMA